MALFRVTLGVLLLTAAGLVARGQEPTPPQARQIPHQENWHGETVTDPYFWLREKSNPEVIAYLNAENAYTEAMTRRLQPLADTIYQEMLGRIKQSDLSVPTRRGDYYYYSRTEEGSQYSIQCRRSGSMDAVEEIVLDQNELARGEAYFSVGTTTVSDDGNLLAYTTDTTGFRNYILHVKDLRTGKLLSDTAERVTTVQWAADNKTLFFTTEEPVAKRTNQFWRHELGAAESELVYEESNALFRLQSSRTRDRKFVLLHINSSDTNETRYLASSEPRGELKVFLPREKGQRYRVEHRDGVFYVCTNKGSKNFRVVTMPCDGSFDSWTDFVAHREDVLVQSVDVYRDFAVVVEKCNGVNAIRVHDFRDGTWHDLNFPEPVYTAFPGFSPDFDEPTFRYSYQSLVTPPSVFDYDAQTRRPSLLKQEEVLGGYDPSQYVSERLWATARDGVKVPLSIVYKRGVKRDGKAPLLLYAYGSYGSGLSPTFSSERLSLLDRGMIFCIAHVRGGNELGEAWRDAGMLMQKKNTFHDFIDSAEYLIKEKWTNPQRLAIEGFSAGGLLVGAVVNERPDLFRAAHAGVPFVDVINTMMDETLPLTVGEYLVWGNPREKSAYEYMKSYSPYENLSRKAYPAMLVTAGLNDSQVMYWEPAKYVARMRTLKTDSNPLVLKVNMAAGHSGSSGRFDRLREDAFQYAWLLSQVGIEE